MDIVISNPQKEAIAVFFVFKAASTSALLEARQPSILLYDGCRTESAQC
jgi:hypothetical protein